MKSLFSSKFFAVAVYAVALCYSIAAFSATPAILSPLSDADATTYKYPYQNNLVATLTGAVTHPTRPVQLLKLEVRKDRRNVPFMKGRNAIVLGYYPQNHPAPLMFVVPGLGGYAGSGSALLLAETYFDAGYSVVTLPNNLSWQYTLGVSETAIPGYLPRDAREYYQFLQTVTAELKNNQNLAITGYGISGFSLGGLLTAFVADLDTHQHVFNFDRVILINPAVDVAYGIAELDGLEMAGDQLTAQRKADVMGLAFNVGSNLLSAPMTVQTFDVALPKLAGCTDAEMKWLIGQSFRQSIRDVLITSQRVHNTGFLKTKSTATQMDAQLNEAAQYSFADYMNLIVNPSLGQSGVSNADIVQQSSLFTLAPLMKKNPKFFVFENADDLIIRPSDLEFLRATLGPRLKLYPHGGHLGNLWYEQNRHDIARTARIVQ